MRHQKQGKKFHRRKGQRAAFLRGLANNLIKKEHIETTVVRAKVLRPMVERLVTLAKHQSLASRRLIAKQLMNKKTVQKIFEEIAPRYQNRPGGYLRIVKLSRVRKRDAVLMARIEFV